MKTQKSLDALEYNPAGPQKQIVWDADAPGFGVRLLPSGTKTYVVLYRVGRGRAAKQRLVVIDDTRRISLKDAREKAREIQLKARTTAEDPMSETYVTEGVTVQQLGERYMNEHARPNKSEASQRNDLSALELHVYPFMGRKPVRDVTPADVAKLVGKIAERAPVQANRVRALLSKMFNLAETWGYRDRNSNPVQGTPKMRERARHVHVIPEQLKAIFAELRNIPFRTASLIQLIAFTGTRPGELTNLRWTPDPAGREPHVDLGAKSVWHPNTKTGPAWIVLSQRAVDVIRAQVPVPGSPYVFPGRDPNEPLRWLNKTWDRVRKAAGVPHLRLHDLRHVFATELGAVGGMRVAQQALRHESVATTAIYVNPAAEHVQAAVDETAERLAGLAGFDLGAPV
jgi:integrase